MNNILAMFTDTSHGNLAYHVGDDKNNVDNNRKNLAKKLNYKYEDLVYMNQVHGNHVEVVTKDSPKLIDNCDGLITNEKNLALMVMVADCIPILLHDERAGVIAVLHAGRNSTFQKIVQVALDIMTKQFDCKSQDIKAILGPSIQKCCYEVSVEMVNIVASNFGSEFVEGRYINLQGINRSILEANGVTNIEISPICTQCSNKPYYSYRKDNKTGRFAGIIKL
ncbi:peptidoglycan editing factor PgeF [Poseidonibacter lekithochrous]|uniref:peptidoglycan editing factor PgeF n=1 Tax=Poseidonibacter lekithochrous TaxID=1904463 RepID=UPI0008FC6B5A|nr:peptidoglycan editing factor PgeF [Poseidonibacter lekithochrous]QKJ23228.1 multi-copper polyphenol oxidoreductase laccase [Poseidonibacter lekithochrous]